MRGMMRDLARLVFVADASLLSIPPFATPILLGSSIRLCGRMCAMFV